jgi:hypothetical protein
MPVFETGAFSHSATSPLADLRRVSSDHHQAPYRFSRIAPTFAGLRKTARR